MLTICSGKISGNADTDSSTVSEMFKPLASTLLNIKIINLMHKSVVQSQSFIVGVSSM